MKRSPGSSNVFSPRRSCAKRGLAGGKLIAVQQDHFRGRFHRALVKTHARAILERPRRGQKSHARIEPVRRLENARGRQNHSPLYLGMVDPREIHRSPLPRHRAFERLSRPIAGRALAAAGPLDTARLPLRDLTLPETSVPVTTVPNPFMANERSIGQPQMPSGIPCGRRCGGRCLVRASGHRARRP